LSFYPAILSGYSFNEIKDLPMDDIYAAPASDLARQVRSERGGGNIEDAIAGNIEVSMLGTLGEAWRDLKGFKLKCHIAKAIWIVPWTALAYAMVYFKLFGAEAQTLAD
jgi:hypothetical protein